MLFRAPSVALILFGSFASAAPPSAFEPDPLAVQRYGAAYRYPQAGWIVLHIEGAPYERGFQHGTLLAEEINSYVRCYAATQCWKAPEEGWKLVRTMTNAMFLRRFDREYLEEMKGIADGAAAAGAKFDNRPLDVIDIAALNLWAEMMTLDGALDATPTGLEGVEFPKAPAKPAPRKKPGHCSAFAATGPATADGKIVFGHISMFSLYPSSFFNVWIDVKPAKGHRILMQTYPGGIYSGMDYYMNDAGLLVCETTIDQTRFNISGETLAARMRKALQYCDSIDALVQTLTASNNGLYTNEWLIADTKTNEIALFELGTAKNGLYRSSKHEWFGGTEGFYWGCNNTKNIDVRLDTIVATNDRPANTVWSPTDRDIAWVKLYQQHKGKIDADFGKLAFTTPPLCGFPSLDAKFTTTDMARDLRTWALFGPPRGNTWNPTPKESQHYPEVRPMASNPWTILTGQSPTAQDTQQIAIDLKPILTPPHNKLDDDDDDADQDEDDHPEKIAWHGTLLPKSDADIWLASGFAGLQQIVSRENHAAQRKECDRCCGADLEKISSSLFAARSRYLRAAVYGDVPLASTKSSYDTDHWYDIASGKGVLVLNELRAILGDDTFVRTMDAYGREHAGQQVTSADFQAAAEKAAGRKLEVFFDYWLHKTGLPKLKLVTAMLREPTKEKATMSNQPVDAGYVVSGTLTAEGGPLPASLEVTLESADDEVTQNTSIDPKTGDFRLETRDKPLRVIVDKYGRAARANGGAVGIYSFAPQIDQTIIVFGTMDDAAANLAAAKDLQKSILEAWYNLSIPIKSDSEVSDEELKTHHIILIGRPATNKITARFASTLPIAFGKQSFSVRGKTYAHSATALIAAGANSLNDHYGVTLIAGLSAPSTLRAARDFMEDKPDSSGPEVKIDQRDGKSISLCVPPKELTVELDPKQQTAAR
jgi:hypothetical protein